MARKNVQEWFQNILLQFIGESDPLLSLLQWIVQQLMIVEAESKVGAKKGEHTDERKTHFSGTRVRRFDTRMGTMYLVVPKLRKGGYIPFFVQEKKRSELALIQVVQEAFINGVSTRKIERVAQSLGIESISASQVSEINKGLSEQVSHFKSRELNDEYPIVWVDALYEKIRDNGKVINMAVLVVCGVNSNGEREILTIEPMYSESEATYREVFQDLKSRGLKKVWLCISDAHEGLKNAIAKEFLGCQWQRCKVHLMRNILAHVPHSGKNEFGAKLKQVWLQPDKDTALKYARMLVDEYAEKYPKAVDTMDNGLEDSLQFFDYPEIDSRKIASTNILERLNREIRRRSKVVGVFPSMESYLRLVACYMMEYSEDWDTDRSYINKDRLDEQRRLLSKVA